MKVRNNILLAYILLLASCGTKVVSIYNTDSSRTTPSTYQLITERESSYLSAENKKVDSLLKTIIHKSLVAQGLSKSSLPDIYVSYLINVYTSTETNRNNNMYNFNYPSSLNYTTRNYKEGVIIINIIDEDRILVWQGSKTFKLTIRKSVHDILPEIGKEIIDTYVK